VRKLKIFFLTVTVIGFVALSGGCKKTYTTVVESKDTVSTSGWLTISDTIYTDNVGDTIYQETFVNSKITQAIISDGIVLGYLGSPESATDTAAALASEYGVYTTFDIGSVTIDSYPADEGGTGDWSTSTTGFLYRYVIVPGSVLATNNLTKQQAKSMSYTAITKLLSAAKTSSPASITQ
jgi:hypothetical protein